MYTEKKDEGSTFGNILKSILAFLLVIGFIYFIIKNNITGQVVQNFDDQLYIISFDTKGANPLDSIIAQKNDQVNLPYLERENYTFLGWVDGNNNHINNPYVVTTDVQLIASWSYNDFKTYNVTFDLNGGYGTIGTKKIKENTTVNEPTTPTRVGYKFLGWYNGSKKFDFSTLINKDINLKAKWEKDPNYKFTVSFYLNDGTGKIETQKVKVGTTVTKPKNPTKTGVTFKGWYLNGSKYDFSTPVNNDITLVAYWEGINYDNVDYVRVDFNENGAKKPVASQLLPKGSKVEQPVDPIRDGYKFLGWFLGNYRYDFNTPVTKNIELRAIFQKNKETAKYHTVTFDVNTGDTKVPSQKVAHNGKVTKPEDPVKKGYVFLGWYYNERLYNFDNPVTKDMTLGAAWRGYSSEKYYVVYFDLNGGSASFNLKQNIIEGGKVKKPSNPTRNGYTFLGWYLNGKTFDFNTTITQGFTLIAMWESNASKERYDVEFQINDGSGSSMTQKVLYGETAIEPEDPIRTGYKFVGWYCDGKLYNFNLAVTKHIVLTAHWEKLSSGTTYYAVTFDLNGGSGVISTQSVPSGGKASKPTNPTKSGYKFNGWTLNGSTFNFSTPITSNITLKASWTK